MAQITKFIHIGVIVENLEKAIENYEKLGFGPWDEIGASGGKGWEKSNVNGEVMDKGIFCRFSKCRNMGVEIELCEPGSYGTYREWFDEHGPGLHHVCCYSATDSYEDMVKTCVDITNGRDLYIDGHWEWDDGTIIEWAYVDMIPETGMIWEIANNPAG